MFAGYQFLLKKSLCKFIYPSKLDNHFGDLFLQVVVTALGANLIDRAGRKPLLLVLIIVYNNISLIISTLQ